MASRIVCLLCLLAGLAFAAGVSGRWAGTITISIDGNDMELPQEVVLKQDGNTVSGTAGPGSGQQWTIGKSRLQGNDLTFEVRTPEGPIFEYRLTVDGDDMSGGYKMTLEGQVSTAKITLKKK